MNKIILVTALICISAAGKLCAQSGMPYLEKYETQNATDKTFDLQPALKSNGVNIRDFVTLKNGKMVLELNNCSDFIKLKNFDEILKRFIKDIAFYKDSLESNNPGNVRIDYVLHEDRSSKEIRFKKYPNNGDLFVNKNGEIAKLKTEQDTVRIVMHVPDPVKSNARPRKNATMKYPVYKSQHAIYVTFYLNDYADLDKVITEKALIDRAIDTFAATQSYAVKVKPYRMPSSAIYSPNYKDSSTYSLFKNKSGLMRYEGDMRGTASGKYNTLTINGNIGAGLVMNTLAPSANISILIVDNWKKGQNRAFSYFGVVFSPYFFFDRDAQNSLHVHNNWFVNAEFGSENGSKYHDGESMGLSSVGIGYLFHQSSDYFHGPTFKLYTNIKLGRVTVSPELIATNSFKQIFPGVTFKFF